MLLVQVYFENCVRHLCFSFEVTRVVYYYVLVLTRFLPDFCFLLFSILLFFFPLFFSHCAHSRCNKRSVTIISLALSGISSSDRSICIRDNTHIFRPIYCYFPICPGENYWLTREKYRCILTLLLSFRTDIVVVSKLSSCGNLRYLKYHRYFPSIDRVLNCKHVFARAYTKYILHK